MCGGNGADFSPTLKIHTINLDIVFCVRCGDGRNETVSFVTVFILGLTMFDLILLADETAGGLNEALPGILNLGGTAFAVWFGWYATTKTIPGIVKDFRDEMAKEREFHQEQVDKLLTKVESVSCRHPAASQAT